ncbi:MAG: peptidoglycan-associated lipoprotein Pal [Geobacteraceae bacterium]|nr:peptidoglycan-associated lipoprotein Pal [Geobacteraceae bacterium]
MRKEIYGMLLMLFCLTIVAGGCTKKQMVKEDDTLGQNPALTSQTSPSTTSTPAPTTVDQEPIVKDESLTESTTAVTPFETIYFDLDSYVLRQDAREALENNAQWLMKKSTGTVRLEGNCDERGSDEYNLALGEKRAKAAKSYLVTLGVPADRLNTISYGKEKPVDPGHNEAAWAKNRRVDFVIVK